MTDRHAPKELEVFQSFSAVCGLCIAPDSIEKRCQPEPDILCRLDDGGGLAFEMVRLTDEKLARQIAAQKKLGRAFDEYCESLRDDVREQLQVRIGNARIFVKMQRSDSLSKRMHAVRGIVQQLRNLDPEFRGKLRLPADLAAIASVTISRGHRKRPLFHVEVVSHNDPIPLDAFSKKFDRTYRSSSPIELLAYFDVLDDAPPESQFQPLYNLIEQRLPSSCFTRVWVFDATTESVCCQSSTPSV